MIRRPPRSTLFPLHDALPISRPVRRDISRVAHGKHVIIGRVPNFIDDLKRGSLLRSEEHTSELQSQSNLVCRLLLEKKKKNDIQCIMLHYTNLSHTTRRSPSY